MDTSAPSTNTSLIVHGPRWCSATISGRKPGARRPLRAYASSQPRIRILHSGNTNSVAAASTATTCEWSSHIMRITSHSVASTYWPFRPSVTIGHRVACTNTTSAVSTSASSAFVDMPRQRSSTAPQRAHSATSPFASGRRRCTVSQCSQISSDGAVVSMQCGDGASMRRFSQIRPARG